MASEAKLYKRYAENAALLELLGKVPVAPSHNAHVGSPLGAADDYVLPRWAERYLTSTLAFLSSITSTKGNHELITAVCVREQAEGLEVLVAKNAEHVQDSGYLKAIKKGFQRIFSILSRASTKPHEELVRDLLDAIVVMCRGRIVSRARVGISKRKGRFFDDIDALFSDIDNRQHADARGPFRKSIKHLAINMRQYCELSEASLGAATKIQDKKLLDIVNESYILSCLPEWEESILGDVSLEDDRPEAAMLRPLVDAIQKLAQYQTSARGLSKIACEYEIIRNSSMTIVQLNQNSFSRHGIKASVAMPEQVFSRVAASRGSSVSFKDLKQNLGLSNSLALSATNRDYAETLQSALKSSRVHAEMQLLWYLDAHQTSKKPRIIASHKDACYLCNAFISFQGMYTIPRSHGRVYPGWRLPGAGMKELREGFVQELERLIIERAENIIRGVQEFRLPMESKLNSVMNSRTTVLATNETKEPQEAGGSTSDAETIMPDDISSIPSSEESSDIVVAEDTAGLAELGVSRVDFAGDAWPTAAPSPRPDEQQSHCENDTPWQAVEQGQTVTLRLTPKLRMHVEYSATQPLRQLRFKTHELSPNEMTDMDANGAEMVYDVHRDLPRLQDVLCRANSRSVCLQMKSSSQQRARRFRVELG